MLHFILVLFGIPFILSFSRTHIQKRKNAIHMGGGRSPTEVGVSKRGMFLQLKQKLRTSAEVPGFFDSDQNTQPVIWIEILF